VHPRLLGMAHGAYDDRSPYRVASTTTSTS
jgi:hypothetical protein